MRSESGDHRMNTREKGFALTNFEVAMTGLVKSPAQTAPKVSPSSKRFKDGEWITKHHLTLCTHHVDFPSY